jgi:ferredoxin-thioredoxin reductase catalytic subunit
MSGLADQSRVFCPVCSIRFRPEGSGITEGDVMVCPVCGQKLVVRMTQDGWAGERLARLSDDEIRTRVDGFARIRGYTFNDMKEEIMAGLLGKRDRFGDFYCPCRLEHKAEYQCPCRPTRGGDVERLGRCHCGLFWKN